VTRAPLRTLLIVGLLLGAFSAPSALAQSASVPGDAFDTLEDAGYAPDVAMINASVQANGAYRKVVFGTWLRSSDLVAGDIAAWQIDTVAGAGQPSFGGEYLISVTGYDGQPDRWSTFEWRDGAWASQALRDFRLWTTPDGKIYWEIDFSTTSTPAAPQYIGIRTITQYTYGSQWWRDYAPNDHTFGVSLEPFGLPDPLEGCTYPGSCVGGASGVGAYGPGENTNGGSSPGGAGGSQSSGSSCADARRALRAAGTKLRKAKAAKRRARTGAARRRKARAVKRLSQRRARLARAVAAQC
jgi:hypothetical protein